MNLVQTSILWLIGASLIGFGMSVIFSGWLKLARRLFLIPYIAISGLVLFLFLCNNPIVNIEFWLHNWFWGLFASIIAGAFLVKNVISQPNSQTGKGLAVLYRYDLVRICLWNY